MKVYATMTLGCHVRPFISRIPGCRFLTTEVQSPDTSRYCHFLLQFFSKDYHLQISTYFWSSSWLSLNIMEKSVNILPSKLLRKVLNICHSTELEGHKPHNASLKALKSKAQIWFCCVTPSLEHIMLSGKMPCRTLVSSLVQLPLPSFSS